MAKEPDADLHDRLARARDFILCNGRLLERHLFAFHFGTGAAEPVVRALEAYQNPDGGFGNALEPDKRVPLSQPQDVEIAFEILDEVGELRGPIVRRACDWLASVSTAEGGVPYALPSTNAYPHAPWWSVKDSAPAANVNPTAAIAGYLLKNEVDHPWLVRAAEFCWAEIEKSETTEFHDLFPMIKFLEHATDRRRAAPLLARIAATIGMPGVVELNPNRRGYLKKPLDWAPSPQSFARPIFGNDIVLAHLEALAKLQMEDGGWPISWEAISPGVELECRCRVTIQALRTLAAYGAGRK